MNIMNAETLSPQPGHAENGKGDRFLFELNPQWAIGADGRQWMVMRRHDRRPGDRRSAWEPLSFIATERRILERVIRERGIIPTPEGQANLDALPAAFDPTSSMTRLVRPGAVARNPG